MKVMKMIFLHTVMITAGIVFLIGLESVWIHFFTEEELVLSWYHPISIVLSGLLGACASGVFNNLELLSKKQVRLRCILHFFLLYATIVAFGRLFNWYDRFRGFLVVSIFFFIIYAFIWVASFWIFKKDDQKINEAIDQIRDEE